MRLQNNVVHFKKRCRNVRLVNENIQSRPLNTPGNQRINQIGFIHQLSAGNIDEEAILAERVEYGVSNLFEASPESLAQLGHFDKMLIDPPREGALELVKAIDANDGPRRIVYVSCSPATLARDAAILVSQKGYRLLGAGVVNMFPNTSHVESIALFERK